MESRNPGNDKVLVDKQHLPRKRNRNSSALKTPPESKAKSKARKNMSRGQFDRSFSKKASQRKFVDASHLISFEFESRSSNDSLSRSSSASKKPYPRKNNLRQLSREEFLLSNCHFRVASGADVSVVLADPDSSLDWQQVEEVILFSKTTQKCPICLGDPIAAQITRCGHVFCWACILHHLAESDKKWHTCPLCSDFVYAKDLRSVIIDVVKEINQGTKLEMVRVARDLHSTIVFPVQQSEHFAYYNNPELLAKQTAFSEFSRIQIISREQIVSRIISREYSELILPGVDQDDPFVQKAIQMLSLRLSIVSPGMSLDQLFPANSSISSHTPSHQHSDNAVKSHLEADHHQPADFVWTSPESMDEPSQQHHTELPFPQATRSVSLPLQIPSDTCMFYQSADGQPVFLHPICEKIIEHEFGSVAQSPELINLKILEIEKLSVNDDFRKRLSRLRHIPYNCEVWLVELDMTTLVSQETLEQFKAGLDRRKAARRRKQRSERKADLRAAEYHRKHDFEAPPSFQNSGNDFPLALSPGQIEAIRVARELDEAERLQNLHQSLDSESSQPVQSKAQKQFSSALTTGIMSDIHENPPLSMSSSLESKTESSPQTSSWRSTALRGPKAFSSSPTTGIEDEYSSQNSGLVFSLGIDASLHARENSTNQSAKKTGNGRKKKGKKRVKHQVLFST